MAYFTFGLERARVWFKNRFGTALNIISVYLLCTTKSMAVILHFEKAITEQELSVPNTFLTIKNCRIYTINNSDAIIGRFYTDSKLSYGEIADKAITIEYENRLFSKSRSFIKDALTSQEVAKLHWNDNAYNLKMQLDIPGQYQYQWENISKGYTSLLKPETWATYAARLSNGPQEITFKGKLHHKTIDTVYNNLVPFSGEIEFLESFDPLLLICALHMLEMDLASRENTT